MLKEFKDYINLMVFSIKNRKYRNTFIILSDLKNKNK